MSQLETEQQDNAAAPPAPPGRWLMLTLLCLAQFMAILDISVVNVALPVIGGSLHLGRDALTWVITAYTVAFGGLLVLGGRLADTLGRKNVFLTGVVLFTAASLTAGLAGSGGALLSSRTVQGLGASMLSPAALSILTTEFTGKERNRALGIWAAISAGGAAVGFVVGGALTSGPGWQWAFYINVPVGLIVLLGVPMVVPTRPRVVERGVDVIGALTGTGAIALAIYGLIRAGDKGWGAASALGPIIGGLVLGALFVLLERRSSNPLVPLNLVSRPPLPGAVVMMAVSAAILIGCYFITSIYLQQNERYSAIHTGLMFLPVAVGTGIGAHLAAGHGAKAGPRHLAIVGLVLATAGLALMGWAGVGGGVADELLPGFVLTGIGIGMTFVATMTSGLSAVGQDDAGVASGVLNTGHELGVSLGIAVLSTVAASSIAAGPGGGLSGFEHAYLVAGAGALALGAVAAHLLPKEQPDLGDGPKFIH